jgi:hypothetical protein
MSTSPAPTFSQETTQATTPTEAQAPPIAAQVTMPTNLIGKNAQFVNVQLRTLGFTDINYTSSDGSSFDPQLSDNWTVTQLSPAPGTVVAITDTVTVTATKKVKQEAPAPAPPFNNSPPRSAYYPNCAAARAAGAAPLYRGQPGYRPALDRDGDGVACEL